jgi:hypothetical protein
MASQPSFTGLASKSLLRRPPKAFLPLLEISMRAGVFLHVAQFSRAIEYERRAAFTSRGAVL